MEMGLHPELFPPARPAWLAELSLPLSLPSSGGNPRKNPLGTQASETCVTKGGRGHPHFMLRRESHRLPCPSVLADWDCLLQLLSSKFPSSLPPARPGLCFFWGQPIQQQQQLGEGQCPTIPSHRWRRLVMRRSRCRNRRRRCTRMR